MDPQQRELLHIDLLRVLAENKTRFGLPAVVIAAKLRVFGAKAAPQAIETEMEYLTHPQNALAEDVDKGQFHSANRQWKITPKGENFLAERGY